MKRSEFLRALGALAIAPVAACGDDPVAPTSSSTPRRVVHRIAILGDTHAGYDGSQGGDPASRVHGAVIEKLREWDVDVVVHLGDVIHNTAPRAWEQFEDLAGSFVRSCAGYWPTVGNHDDGDGGLASFFSYFRWLPPECSPQRPWYVVRVGREVAFLVLYVKSPAEAPPNCTDYAPQRSWLAAALDSVADVPLRLVVFHRPPYTTGGRGSDRCARAFDDAFAGAVDAVLCGHIHAYERFRVGGIPYVVSGGAGGFPHALETARDTAALLPTREAAREGYHYLTLRVEGNEAGVVAALEAHALDGSVFDEVVFRKDRPVANATAGRARGKGRSMRNAPSAPLPRAHSSA